MQISSYLCALIQYAQKHQLIDEVLLKERKKVLFSLYGEEEISCNILETYRFEQIMYVLLKKAYSLNLYPIDTIDEMDAFEAKLIDILMPTPEEVKSKFHTYYLESPKKATNYLYQLSQDVNYIKVNRLKENVSWTYPSRYGKLGVTINLAKPEKDPRDIAKAKDLDTSKSHHFIPKCVICKENEHNYYNARMNLRIVPMTLGNEKWHFQYSPYQYYNEHAIILHDEHKPMQIKDKTFTYLLDFVDQFSEYFIGSNADLPIVGGSILNHDHFQAGKYKFPIEDAKIIDTIQKDEVSISILKWPLSTIRISSKYRDEVIKYAKHYFHAWKTYANPKLSIIPATGDT
ncbi:MAG: galactose-1-phosphate uridylyltransferase, partial [Bacillota bacterium]